MVSTIWHCPDCGTDLDDGWCPRCEAMWSWHALAADDPPEYEPEDDDD